VSLFELKKPCLSITYISQLSRLFWLKWTGNLASPGVQSLQLSFNLTSQLRGLWTYVQHIRSGVCPRSSWLKSKRPLISLPYNALSWPLELQRGQSPIAAPSPESNQAAGLTDSGELIQAW